MEKHHIRTALKGHKNFETNGHIEIKSYQDEEFYYPKTGRSRMISRVFFEDIYERGYDVGWVLNEGVTACMICMDHFDTFGTWKHHCRACGSVVCDLCSQQRGYISEFKHTLDEEKHRVCDACVEISKDTLGSFPSQEIGYVSIRRGLEVSSTYTRKFACPDNDKEEIIEKVWRTGPHAEDNPGFQNAALGELSASFVIEASTHSSSTVTTINVCICYGVPINTAALENKITLNGMATEWVSHYMIGGPSRMVAENRRLINVAVNPTVAAACLKSKDMFDELCKEVIGFISMEYPLRRLARYKRMVDTTASGPNSVFLEYWLSPIGGKDIKERSIPKLAIPSIDHFNHLHHIKVVDEESLIHRSVKLRCTS